MQNGTCGIEYRNASFRGIEFEILPASNTGGRHINTSKFPFTDSHYNEDLGDKAERFSIRGAFTGAEARDRLTAARRIWNTEGRGIFYEPTENRSWSVILIDRGFDFNPKSINYIEFTIELIEDGSNPYPTQSGGLLGSLNSTMTTYLSAVDTWYDRVMEGVTFLSEVLSGYEAARDFLFNLARQNAVTGFVEVISSINSSQPSTLTPLDTSETVEELYELASDRGYPIIFFRQATELRLQGTNIEGFQAQLFALKGLAYHFEKIADGANYTELAIFRERAESLKFLVPEYEIENAIDCLLLAAGKSTNTIVEKTLEGVHHSLVASYELYGDISNAANIIEWSGGVSGAQLVNPCYR